MKKWLALLLTLTLWLPGLASCAKKDKLPAYERSDEVTDTVILEIEGYGKILLRLYPDIAPLTVANFQMLVAEDFYDGLIFHRIADLTGEDGYIIQGGDPQGNGTGGSEHTIKGEFSRNGVPNSLSHTRGVISMARATPYDSASSQFFICAGDCSFLDGSYAAFGEVIAGIKVVDAIAAVPVNSQSKPSTDVVIREAYFVTLDE
ncbi:MAG: peptidylprolyl isomerase [Eubacteriales bacterium]